MIAGVVLLIVSMAAPAAGDDPQPSPSSSVTATPGDGQFGIGLAEDAQADRTKDESPADSGGNDPSSYHPQINKFGPCVGAAYLSVALGEDGPEVTYCHSEKKPETVTVGMVRTAFAALKLPGSKLTIQPPDGLTLVNFKTNFYTDDVGAITKTVTLLGQRVTIEATPSLFTWRFDDGYIDETTSPGAPYPDLIVTHKYVRKTTYHPSLSTTYSGRFKVGNGPWRDIPGTVRIDGPRQRLRAIEATPKLVGYGSP